VVGGPYSPISGLASWLQDDEALAAFRLDHSGGTGGSFFVNVDEAEPPLI